MQRNLDIVAYCTVCCSLSHIPCSHTHPVLSHISCGLLYAHRLSELDYMEWAKENAQVRLEGERDGVSACKKKSPRPPSLDLSPKPSRPLPSFLPS